MILENDQLLAHEVPHLTDEDLEWMDADDAREAINANYEAWEQSREAARDQLCKTGTTSLAKRLTLKAKRN